MVEDRGLLGETVEVRRVDPAVAVAAQVIPPEAVGHDHDDVHVRESTGKWPSLGLSMIGRSWSGLVPYPVSEKKERICSRV